MTEDNSPATRKDLDQLEVRMTARFEEMSEQMRDIETAMLKGFHSYAQSVTAQFQQHGAAEAATQVRLAALENRVLELETRRRSL